MKLVKLLRDNNVNPLMVALPLVTQMPIFVSFFFALRKMAELPVCCWCLGSTKCGRLRAWSMEALCGSPTWRSQTQSMFSLCWQVAFCSPPWRF